MALCQSGVPSYILKICVASACKRLKGETLSWNVSVSIITSGACWSGGTSSSGHVYSGTRFRYYSPEICWMRWRADPDHRGLLRLGKVCVRFMQISVIQTRAKRSQDSALTGLMHFNERQYLTDIIKHSLFNPNWQLWDQSVCGPAELGSMLLRAGRPGPT